MNFSVQLYTMREYEDFNQTLKWVAEMGYYGVEFAGYHNIPADQMKKSLDSLGLKAVGSHVGIERLRDSLEAEIAYCVDVGCKYMICPSANAHSAEGWQKLAAELEGYGKKAAQSGIVVGYHNHAHEFATFDGRYALDILFENAPSLVVELDTFWVEKGGENPVSYMKKYGGRLTHIHIKDMDDDGQDAAAGAGRMDIKSILETAREMGCVGFVVENDLPKPTGYDCILDSINYLRGI